MAGPYTNSSSWMGMTIEVTPGTAPALPIYWIPVTSPQITPMITEVMDSGFRGSMVKDYRQIPTVRHDEYTFTCLGYYDTMPALFRSLLGGADVITGTVAPATHKISLLNNAPATGNQGPTYTFYDFDGYKVRQIPGAVVDEISVKFSATGMVELTVKVIGQPYTLMGSVPATGFTTVVAAPGWSCTPTINSIAASTLVDGELSLKRGSKPVHVMGAQAPKWIQPGPLDISGKLTVINTLDTEMNFYLNDTRFPVSLAFSPPLATVDIFTFQMSQCAAANAVQSRGSDELIVTAFDIEPEPNATDANSGGLSPIMFIALTSLLTTY